MPRIAYPAKAPKSPDHDPRWPFKLSSEMGGMNETGPTASVFEEAIAVIRRGLGKAELEYVASATAPFFGFYATAAPASRW